MKLLVIFALIFAVSYASYVPQWKVLNNYSNQFQTTGVLAQSVAVLNQYNMINVCGVANSDFTVNGFNYQIGQNNVVWYTGATYLPQQLIYQGSPFCFNFPFQVPVTGKPGFYVYLTLVTTSNTNVVTVEVDFTC